MKSYLLLLCFFCLCIVQIEASPEKVLNIAKTDNSSDIDYCEPINFECNVINLSKEREVLPHLQMITVNTTVTTPIQCNGDSNGTVSAIAGGGTLPYSYLWSNGETASTINGLASGVYEVVVVDANNDSATASVTLSDPPMILSSIAAQPVTCFGNNDGAASVMVNGGVLPYSFLWNSGQITPTATGLSTGMASVTVTDANNCTVVESIGISTPALISISAVETKPASCAGNNGGEATATVTGGTPPYSFSWSNGATTPIATGLSAGTYTVSVTDANNCFADESVTITGATILLASVNVDNQITCNGLNDGQLTAIENGGTAPFTYTWSNGDAAATINNLAPGTYGVTITDANNCSATSSGIITEPAPITFDATGLSPTCNGGNDGSATISNIAGGTPSYIVTWSNGQVGMTATGLTAGNYRATITDANNCTASQSATIGEPTAIATTTIIDNQVSCNGGDDGAVSVTANGGKPPYTYNWSNGDTTPAISNLTAGNYDVTVTDDNNCSVINSVLISDPTAISFTLSAQPVSCNGKDDGSASVSGIAGGLPSYSVNWSNGQTGMTANNLTAGNYSVTVSDANGCSSIQNITVVEPSLLTANVAVDNQVSCNGANDGQATVTPAGGISPYTYIWSANANGSTMATINNLAAGSYTVTVTDANNCVVVAGITITEPQPLVGVVSSQPVSCNGEDDGSATAGGGGGTPPYSFDWSNGMSGATINGLSGGGIQVTITDANGCKVVKSGNIQEPTAITLNTSIVSMVSCNGFNDGAVTAFANGGTGTLSYLWSNGATTVNLNNLTVGTYTVSITDDNGCIATESVTITEPSLLTSNSSVQHVSCFNENDGSISLVTNGGTTPYSYDWSSGQNSSTINGLASGNYSVTITDGNNCELVKTFSITTPAFLIANALVDKQISCNGADDGEASAVVNGGTSPYMYSWSNGDNTPVIDNLAPGAYTVTVIDANQCEVASSTIIIVEPSVMTGNVTAQAVSCFGSNDGTATVNAVGGNSPYSYDWSNGQSGSTANNLPTGMIQVTITDADGCTVVASSTVGSSTQINTVTAEDSPVSCYGINDGAASVSANGGMPPYSYLWSNGATSASINNITAGTYSVTVTDANNCDQVSSVVVNQPVLLTANLQLTSITCSGANDGAITAVVNGGTAPYSYNWSNGFSSSSLSNLQPGSYIVTITDDNGCITIKSIVVTNPSLLSATIQLNNDVSCNGGNDGSATVSAFGGTSPYTYSWDSGESTPTANQLTAGTNAVTITDSKGCERILTVVVDEPNGISGAFPSITSVSCNGGNDGSATVAVNGGQAPYTYNWDTGATSATANSLTSGIHRVTVTDASGCRKVFSINITQPTALSLTVTQTQPASCKGNDDGIATAVGGNGAGSYTYQWSNGATGNTANGFSAGTHQVTLTDANGCKRVGQVTITQSYIPLGSVWKYLDNGSNQATAWRSSTFNDASWNSGAAQLGYGDGDETTVVSFGNNQNNKHITTYFRKTVNITDSRYTTTGGEISILHDDGAVIYLNGSEIYRSANLPGGNIAYNTQATYSWPENSYENVIVDANKFNLGTNVFAVEIHQRAPNSSDISFDLSLCESPEPDIIRGPYLQLGTENSMIVRFRTNLTSRAQIVYGTNPNNLTDTTALSPATTEHEVFISGLSPSVKYYYEIILNNALILPNTNEHYFVTSPPVATPGDYRLWILGDCGTANNNQRAVRNGFINFNGGDAHPDLMLFLGDNAYNNGTDTEYQNAIFENMYENTLRNTVSLSTPGNHDYYSGADADTETGTYYDIFNFPRNGEAGGLASGTEAYYSYDYGNIHIISMDSHDSDRSVGGAMLTWLENDLANTTQEWIIAIWHHPAYSKGSHNSDTETYLVQMRQNALPILENAGVDLILSGHSHSYERSKFVKGHYGHSSTFNNTMVVQKGAGHASVDSAYCKYSDGHFDGDGMVYITAGASGKISGGTLNHPVMYYSKSELGSVVVDVQGGVMDVSYVGHDNQVKDQFTIMKKANYDPATDQDGDGYSDIEECPTGWPCVDSDNDGEPDIRDEDSDGDNTPDITDPCRLGQGLVASVLLEGPMDNNSPLMLTTLNTVRRILPGQTPVSGAPPTPVGQPYNKAPWNYNGTEGANFNDSSYGTDVVDWILVSLRTNTGPSSEVWRAAALLNADGSIEFLDACLPQNLWNGNYYVLIEHRNHMGTMSANRISVSDGIFNQDFRTGDSYTANGTGFGQIEVLSGVWAMYAGDLDQSDSPSYDINGSDYLIQNASNGIFNQYLPADANLNGDVNGADKILWNKNNGFSSRVPR